jgi:2-aminoadipate transaminase
MLLEKTMNYEFADRMAGMTGSVIREMLKSASKPGVISFAGGLPASELFDTEGLRMASAQALENPEIALQYGVTEGVMALREQLALMMWARGALVQAEQLIVTTGALQAISLLGDAILNPGDTVVLERPTFPAATDMARLRQANIRTVGMDKDGLNLDELEAILRRERVKFIYVVPNFGNPSGAMLSLERRLRLLEMAIKYRILILEDDPYGELYFESPPPPSLLALSGQVPGARDYLISISSLSKIVSPGLRIGWMVAPAEILRQAVIIKQGQDAHSSTFAQIVALNYLKSDRLRYRLPTWRRAYKARCETMVEAIKMHLPSQLEFDTPAGGMFLWARWRDGRDSTALLQRALEHDVVFVPGAPFMGGQPDRATLRLSFSSSEPGRILRGIQRLARARMP